MQGEEQSRGEDVRVPVAQTRKRAHARTHTHMHGATIHAFTSVQWVRTPNTPFS